MSCYKWELEAILEGLSLKRIDEQEQNIALAFNLRYILNAKKPQLKKVFDKSKLENKVKKAFGYSKDQKKDKSKVYKALEHFRKKGGS